MLRHGEYVRAFGLSVPAGDTGEPVGDVLDFDVERRGVEQVEPAARQHPLPGARNRAAGRHAGSGARCHAYFLLPWPWHASWKWHFTRWSLAMPTACMKA